MVGPGDEISAAGAGDHSPLRASHADREQVIDALKAAFVDGRLTKDEFDLRVGQVLVAYANLDALTADIPAPARPTAARPAAAGLQQPGRQQPSRESQSRNRITRSWLPAGPPRARARPWCLPWRLVWPGEILLSVCSSGPLSAPLWPCCSPGF